MGPKILEATDLVFSYGDRPVLNKIKFSMTAAESVGLVGANGAGKSTLLKIFLGLLEPFDGKVLTAGLPVVPENFPAIRRAAAYVFQDADNQLFMETVSEDVAFSPKQQGLSPDAVKAIAADALRRAKIEDLAERQIYRLSGGQKKLAAIAGVLAMRPKIILFDEPSASLDPVNRENLASILNDLPIAKFITSHDLDFVLDTCQRVIILSGGRIAADGASKTILSNRSLLENNGLRLPLSLSSRK